MGTTEGAHFLNITKLRREDKSKLTAATYKHYGYDTKKERQQKKHDLSNIKASLLPKPPPKKNYYSITVTIGHNLEIGL